MKAVVTGAAGFIGSHVAEAMAATGHDVVAVDVVSPAALVGRVKVLELDLAADDLSEIAGADVVLHLAGRPGVRASWENPAAWTRDNVVATRRLLDACRETKPRIVIASSSSVYGSATDRPHREQDRLKPASPYARTKVEVEQMAMAATKLGMQTVILRYFSVYGSRQRPDMAFHRFIEAALRGEPLPVFGDGSQSRAFTHVSDVVGATVSAATMDIAPGTVLNIGHPESTRVDDAIQLLSRLLGKEVAVSEAPPARGDSVRTWAAVGRAARILGWRAKADLEAGLTEQIGWHRDG